MRRRSLLTVGVTGAMAGLASAADARIDPQSPEVKRAQRSINTQAFRQLGDAYACYVTTDRKIFLNVVLDTDVPKATRIVRRLGLSRLVSVNVVADPSFGATHREAVFRDLKQDLATQPFAAEVTVVLRRNVSRAGGDPRACPAIGLIVPLDRARSSEAAVWIERQQERYGALVASGASATLHR